MGVVTCARKSDPQIDQLLLETFSELHKNNTPEEAFVFLMVKLFNKRYPSVSSRFLNAMSSWIAVRCWNISNLLRNFAKRAGLMKSRKIR